MAKINKIKSCLARVLPCHGWQKRAFLIRLPAGAVNTNNKYLVCASNKRLPGLQMPLQQVEWQLFCGLPGGNRNNNGNFNNIGNNGNWWSASENNTNKAWNRNLNYNNSNFNRNNNNKSWGFSVRCVRDWIHDLC